MSKPRKRKRKLSPQEKGWQTRRRRERERERAKIERKAKREAKAEQLRLEKEQRARDALLAVGYSPEEAEAAIQRGRGKALPMRFVPERIKPLSKETKPKKEERFPKPRRKKGEPKKRYLHRVRSVASKKGAATKWLKTHRPDVIARIDGRTPSGHAAISALIAQRDPDLIAHIKNARARGKTLREIMNEIFSP